MLYFDCMGIYFIGSEIFSVELENLRGKTSQKKITYQVRLSYVRLVRDYYQLTSQDDSI